MVDLLDVRGHGSVAVNWLYTKPGRPVEMTPGDVANLKRRREEYVRFTGLMPPILWRTPL